MTRDGFGGYKNAATAAQPDAVTVMDFSAMPVQDWSDLSGRLNR